jgi:hypothetical protein
VTIQSLLALQSTLSEPPLAGVPFGPFILDRVVKAGDLLTPITVFLSVLTFAWTIRKDLQSRQSVEADRVRAAAAQALGRLDRWKELALWYYRDIAATFVETSDLLAQEFDVGKARDHLWAALSAAHIKSAERLLNESLETAFINLSSSYPGVYDAFGKTIEEMKNLDAEAFGELLEVTQAAVLSYQTKHLNYMPPMLGNDLRRCAGAVSALLKDQLEAAGIPIRTFLISTIKQNDEELLTSKGKGAAVSDPPRRRYKGIAEFLQRNAADRAKTEGNPASN